MPELPRDRTYVGLAGHVIALEESTGREVWRTKLIGRDLVTTAISGGRLLAGTRGRVYALDPLTGAILWENAMKGLGYGFVGFPGTGPAAAAAARLEQQRRAAAAS